MFRHEEKYLINNLQLEKLKNRLSAIMYLDSNTKNKEENYFIRSLYFDDYYNTSYFQVLNGISDRNKYRIRYYDFDDSYITLEKKHKINNLGEKEKDVITKNIVNKLISNKDFVTDKNLVNELLRKIKTNLYKPIVIIDYLRIAYTYPLNDVRITIDYNISCSNEIEKFFDKNINSIPLLDKNLAILEVKYNDYLPNFIKKVIDIKGLEVTSFSKYSNGRSMLEKIERSV